MENSYPELRMKVYSRLPRKWEELLLKFMVLEHVSSPWKNPDQRMGLNWSLKQFS